jgi:hypothetical protein
VSYTFNGSGHIQIAEGEPQEAVAERERQVMEKLKAAVQDLDGVSSVTFSGQYTGPVDLLAEKFSEQHAIARGGEDSGETSELGQDAGGTYDKSITREDVPPTTEG